MERDKLSKILEEHQKCRKIGKCNWQGNLEKIKDARS